MVEIRDNWDPLEKSQGPCIMLDPMEWNPGAGEGKGVGDKVQECKQRTKKYQRVLVLAF